MARGSSDAQDLMEEISEQLSLSRELEDRRRVENLQILLGIGIIGAYFTAPAQDFITNLEIGATTGVFIYSIVAYLLLKLFVLTIRTFLESQKLAILGEFIMPLYFTTVVFGYIIWNIFQLLTISINIEISADQAALVAVVISAISGIVYSYQSYNDYRERKAEEELLNERISGRRFEHIVNQHPELIEEGFDIVYHNDEPGIINVDFIARDDEGRDVLLELKRRIDSSTVGQIIHIFDLAQENSSANYERRIVLTESSTEAARQLLESEGIEVEEINIANLYDRIYSNV